MTAASIVIPTRGGVTRLPRLFQALATQRSSDFEVICVVDGDVDGSTLLINSWTRQLPVRAITLPENMGRAAALNIGFTQARGRVLIRCDDDLEPGPDHVARHVEHHASADQVGVIGLCPNVMPDTAYARAYGHARDKIFLDQAYAFPPDQRWRLWGANVSVVRETWDAVGGYDTTYRAYGFEDVDWGFRLHQLKFPIVLDPDLEARHHGAATTAKVRAMRAFHSGAARRTFEHLHGTAALGGTAPPRSMWERFVAGSGRHLSANSVARLAGGVDRLAQHLPHQVAEKIIAFSVESAAVAGHHRPTNLDHSI